GRRRWRSAAVGTVRRPGRSGRRARSRPATTRPTPRPRPGPARAPLRRVRPRARGGVAVPYRNRGTLSLVTAQLPGWRHVYSGKVRDLYEPHDGSDRILVVASDRISAYDHTLPTPIPDKGKVLTALSVWWFEQLGGIVGNHLITTEVGT